MAEINVTPMVDVMLVLLIIFMVSAPLLTVGVPIDLPQTQAKSLDQDKEPLTVSVNTKGEVYPAEFRDQDRRTGAEAAGDHAGARRHRRAHLCARRQEGGLRYGDARDGTALGGRLPPRRAGDGGRAGLLTDEGRVDHIGGRCTRACSRGGWSRSPPGRSSAPPPEFLSDRHHLGRRLLADHAGRAQTAPKAEAPKPLVEKVAEAKPVGESDRQGGREARDRADRRSAAAASPSRRRRPSRSRPSRSRKPKPEPKQAFAKEPEPKPDPIAEALKKDDTRSPRRSRRRRPRRRRRRRRPSRRSSSRSSMPSRIAALLDKRDPQRRAATGSTLSNTPSLGTATGTRRHAVAERDRRAARAAAPMLERAGRRSPKRAT